MKDLGSKLSVIPQDVILLRDSIRKNLDSCLEYANDKLWDALRRTGLIEESNLDIVKKQVRPDNNATNGVTVGNNDSSTDVVLHKFHLDQAVEDEGSNFSP